MKGPVKSHRMLDNTFHGVRNRFAANEGRAPMLAQELCLLPSRLCVGLGIHIALHGSKRALLASKRDHDRRGQGSVQCA